MAVKNHIFNYFFHTKLSQLCLEAETKTNRHFPVNINQQEAARAVIVSRLRAGITVKEIMSYEEIKTITIQDVMKGS
jgi:hypothetical protein